MVWVLSFSYFGIHWCLLCLLYLWCLLIVVFINLWCLLINVLIIIHFFLLLSSIPLYEYRLFIPLPSDEPLGCFQVLTIINISVINICTQVIMWTYALFLLGKYIGEEWVDHMVGLTFKENAQLFLKWFYHVTFLLSMFESLSSSSSFPILGMVIKKK